jgi:hypothetical protein
LDRRGDVVLIRRLRHIVRADRSVSAEELLSITIQFIRVGTVFEHECCEILKVATAGTVDVDDLNAP